MLFTYLFDFCKLPRRYKKGNISFPEHRLNCSGNSVYSCCSTTLGPKENEILTVHVVGKE